MSQIDQLLLHYLLQIQRIVSLQVNTLQGKSLSHLLILCCRDSHS